MPACRASSSKSENSVPVRAIGPAAEFTERCAGSIVTGPTITGAAAAQAVAERRRMALMRATSSRGGQGFCT